MSAVLPVPHPRFEDREGKPWYRWKDTAVPPSTADMYSGIKRLTDAELAAEYWRARWTGLMHESRGASLTDEHRAKIATVERFMELPHYDEANR